MAIVITDIVQAESPADLATKVAASIADGNQPVNLPFLIGQQSGVVRLVQLLGTGTGNEITEYNVVSSQSITDFAESLEAAVNETDAQLFGALMVLGDTSAYREYVQVVAVGTIAGGGGGSEPVELPATGTDQELEAGTVTDVRLWSPKAIHDEVARQIAAIPPAGE